MRDLLGLADAETVDGFVAALADGDAAAGIALLDGLEDRGRDLRVFLDQVVDALRDRLLAGWPPAADDAALAPPPAGSVPSTRRASAPVGCASSSSSRCSIPRPAPTPAAAQPVAAAAQRRTAAPRHGRRAPAARPPSPPARRRREHPPATARAATPAPADRRRAGAPSPAAPTRRRRRARPAAATPAEPGASGGDLERLRRGWRRSSPSVSKSPALKPLIEACRPIGVEGNVVTLGFPEEKDFLREIAERKRAGIEEGIAGYLGHEVGIRCVVSNLDLLPPLPEDADAAHILAEAQRIFAEDMADVGEVN